MSTLHTLKSIEHSRRIGMNTELGVLQARYGFNPSNGTAELGYYHSNQDYSIAVIVTGIPEGCPGTFCETPIAEYFLKREDYNDPNQRILTFKQIGANVLWSKLQKKSKAAAKVAAKAAR